MRSTGLRQNSHSVSVCYYQNAVLRNQRCNHIVKI